MRFGLLHLDRRILDKEGFEHLSDGVYVCMCGCLVRLLI